VFLDTLHRVEKGCMNIAPQDWNSLYIFENSSQEDTQSQFQYLNGPRSKEERRRKSRGQNSGCIPRTNFPGVAKVITRRSLPAEVIGGEGST